MIKTTILSILFPFLILAQSKKFKDFSEQYTTTQNSYLLTENWKSFFASGDSKQILDIEDVDQELLNATVFFTFNKLRVKKKRAPLNFSKALYEGCNVYGNYYRSGSFNKKDANNKKANKCIRYVAKKYNYNGAFQKTYLDKPQALNKRNRASYHFDKKAEEGTGYYYGDKPKVKDSTKELKPIELHTYESFAEEIVSNWFKGRYSKSSKGKAYTEAACYVFIDKKNVRKRYIPYAKVLFVTGGRRMLFIPEEI